MTETAEYWCRTWPLDVPGMSSTELESLVWWYLQRETRSVGVINIITGIPRVEIQRTVIDMIMSSDIRGTGVYDSYYTTGSLEEYA